MEPVEITVRIMPGAVSVPFITATAPERLVFGREGEPEKQAEIRITSIPLKEDFRVSTPLDFGSHTYYLLANIDLYAIPADATESEANDVRSRINVSDVRPDPSLGEGAEELRVVLNFAVEQVFSTIDAAYREFTDQRDSPTDLDASTRLFLLWPEKNVDEKIKAASSFQYGSFYAVAFSAVSDAGIASWEKDRLILDRWPIDDLMIISRYP